MLQSQCTECREKNKEYQAYCKRWSQLAECFDLTYVVEGSREDQAWWEEVVGMNGWQRQMAVRYAIPCPGHAAE